MPYTLDMKAHLTRYKRERLGVLDDGFYMKDGLPRSHILPQSLLRLNILETIRREFWRYFEHLGLAPKLHRDFHHLNSSQAMAFNLLFPFFGMQTDCAAYLLSALGLDVRKVCQWSFEAIPDPKEGTTVDFLATFVDGARLLVEVKLTETNFSSCNNTAVYQHRLNNVYSPRLQGKVAAGALSEVAFCSHYQLFRNVSLLDQSAGDVLVLVVPRGNVVPWNTATTFRQRFLNEECQQNVRLMAVEEIFPILAEAIGIGSPVLRAHIELLAEKYLLPLRTEPGP